VYYEEPDLSGGVEGIDYTISYGTGEGLEEESDNYSRSIAALVTPKT
jgi:hypothetical protein